MQNLTKIPILNFEAYADNDHLLLAEKLFEENMLTGLVEVKKGFWEGIVSDEREYFTKIGIFREHVVQAACSCTSESDILCAHTVCTLFGIRQKQLEAEVPKIPATYQKKALNTRQLLDHAGNDELKRFVLAFSKKDKKFRILLMTYFARQFHEQSEGSIYRQILEDCFPVTDVLLAKNSRQNVQLLVMVSNELLLQTKDSLSLEKYTEAFQILKELITKLAYAANTHLNTREHLDDLLIQAHGFYNSLLESPLAPTFKQQLTDTMLEFIQVSFYHYTGQNNFFNKLAEIQLAGHRLDGLLRAIQQKINSIRNIDTQALLFSIRLRIQFACGEPVDLTIEKLKDPVLLNETILQLNKPEHKELLELFLGKLKSEKLISATMQYKHLLSLYISLNDVEKQLFYATELFRLTRELQYYRMLKSIQVEGKNLSHKQFIESKLHLHHDRDLRLALEMCVLESDWKLLAGLLSQKASLDWFMEYDKHLAKENKVEVYNFYRDYLLKYHQDHIGLKAANQASAVISHLEKIGMAKEGEKLKKELIAHFPKRTSLKEHL